MNFEYSINKSVVEQNLKVIALERAALKNLKGLSYWLFFFGL